MTLNERHTLQQTALGILSRYKPPPLDAHEYRRRVAEAEKEKRDPGRVAKLRMNELQQSVLQAMADPDWKRHPVLSRAFFDAGNSRITVDGESIEMIPWEDRLAANGLTERPV